MTSMSLTLNPNGSAQSFGSHHGSLSASHRRVSTPQQQQPTIKYIEALDHLSTKLKIPVSAVEPTNALQDDGLVPGICRLYLEGRCRQGGRCFQVHVCRDVLEQLRKEALETPSCCYLHGAPCNYEGLPFNLTVNIGSRSVGLHSITPTNCLWSVYGEHGENELNVAKGRICREHRRGLCRFGEECGFLHICREVPLDGDEYISATPMPIPRVQGKVNHSSNGAAAVNNNNNNNNNNYMNGNHCSNANSLSIHHNNHNYNNNNNADFASENGTHHINGTHADEGNITAQSFSANSFNAASFNGCGFSNNNNNNTGLNGHYGHGLGLGQSSSFLGAESNCGSFSSLSRSRPSFSHRMKQNNNNNITTGEGESMLSRGPLLRPLGGGGNNIILQGGGSNLSLGGNQGSFQGTRGGVNPQRHNPYGEASSFH